MFPKFVLSSETSQALIGLVALLLQISTCSSQNFDPDVNDKEYLDRIQKRLQDEAMEAQAVMINQTRILQQVTRTFIESKIKENLFEAVRERVEEELTTLGKANATQALDSAAESYSSSRQARQDEEDDDVPTKPTTPRPRPGLLPQLANVVSTFFGSDVNLTNYIKDATSFFPPDISNRIITAASLIDPSRFAPSTTPPPLIINGHIIPQGSLGNGTTFVFPGVPSETLNQQNINAINQHGINLINQQGSNVAQSSTSNNTTGLGVQPGVAGQATSSPQQLHQTNIPQSSVGGNEIQQQIAAPLPLAQPGTTSQGNVNAASGISSQLQQPSPVFPNPQPNFKVNQPLTSPVLQQQQSLSSNEDEDDSSEKKAESKNPQDEEYSSEDDLPVARDDKASASIGYLDEYAVVKYAFRLFNHLTARATVPTTTEFMNTTTVEKTLDSIEEEEAKATSPATSRYKQIVQSGIYLYEGAREAYQLLQNVNKFLDRVGDRLEGAGYGPDDVGVELQ